MSTETITVPFAPRSEAGVRPSDFARAAHVYWPVIFDRRFRRPLMAFFLRRGVTYADAEDLVQDVFMRLSDRGDARILEPENYVFTVAANLLRDRGRRERVRNAYCQARRGEVDVDGIDPFRVASARQRLTLLENAIAQLPAKTRSIFILYRVDHVEKRQIAERFGLTVRMIELHIQAAMRTLLERIANEPVRDC